MLKTIAMMDPKNSPWPDWTVFNSHCAQESWTATSQREEPFFYFSGMMLGLWFDGVDRTSWASAVAKSIPSAQLPWFDRTNQVVDFFLKPEVFSHFRETSSRMNVAAHSGLCKLLADDFNEAYALESNATWEPAVHLKAVIHVNMFCLSICARNSEQSRTVTDFLSSDASS